MTIHLALESKSKSTSNTHDGFVEEVRVPRWVTDVSSFPGSLLSEVLTLPRGASYGYVLRPADPLGVSSGMISRAVNDLVMGWLAENLTDPAALDPADYLFEDPGTEAVPTAWLEAIFALPVRERHEFVMTEDPE